jgi:hypothetical protein
MFAMGACLDKAYQALHIITPLFFGRCADCQPEVLISPRTKALDPFPRNAGEPARRINAVAKLALGDQLVNDRVVTCSIPASAATIG